MPSRCQTTVINVDVPVIMLVIAKLPQEVVEVEAEVIAVDEAVVVEEIVTITMAVEVSVV